MRTTVGHSYGIPVEGYQGVCKFVRYVSDHGTAIGKMAFPRTPELPTHRTAIEPTFDNSIVSMGRSIVQMAWLCIRASYKPLWREQSPGHPIGRTSTI